MGRLTGRVAAITGASAGIGRATALALAREGAIVIASARRAERLQDLVAAIRSTGGEAVAIESDVTSAADMARVVSVARDRYGRLDLMICNAGIGYPGRLDETSIDDMQRLVNVNVMGTLYAAREALLEMRRQGHGHIIAVSSIVGRRGVGGSSVYSATKAAQVALIESLRAEFVGTPFHASVVFPVSTMTEFRDAIARDFGHRVSGHGPQQQADDVADAIVRCAISPRPEVYPFGPAKLLSVFSVVAPGLADRFVRRFRRGRAARDSSDAGDSR